MFPLQDGEPPLNPDLPEFEVVARLIRILLHSHPAAVKCWIISTCENPSSSNALAEALLPTRAGITVLARCLVAT